MKIAAVVILYHPEPLTVENIKTYYDYVDKIFVFDNTEEESLINADLKRLSKVAFHHDFNNDGIARRLNEACEIARNQQFEWILTMDQDSSFSDQGISGYFNCCEQYKKKDIVAVFGTSFSRNTQIVSDNCKANEAGKLITSGSLINLSLFEKVGKFDEALFIDSVDYDYCFRAKIAGFSIIQFPNIYILHPIGVEVYRSSIKSFFLIKKKKEIHSPVRIYYMYRNMLYLKKKYKDYDKNYIAEIRGYVLSRIKTCLLYGRQTRQILKYLIAARRDYKNNNMGKIR